MTDVTLNQKEQARLFVLNSVLEYQVPIADAAELLGVTQRHARRMLAAYRERGAAALAHGNRGRRPHNATAPGKAAAVVRLATERYEGANHTHLTGLLSERDGIDLSRPTVRRILTKVGIGSPRSRRSPQHRFRRQRMPQAGTLIQLDGSHHAWLEDRSPKFALLLAVDDATSAVVNAVFCTSETTAGYFTLLEGLIKGWGIPLALYSARPCSSTTPAIRRLRRKPPSSRDHCRSWASGRSSLARPRPRAVWNGRREPSSTGW